MLTTTSAPDMPIAAPTAAAPVPHLRIRPRPGWVPVNVAEMWQYRELLAFFAMRDVKVRYKQTVLGIMWAVIQPVTMMLLFTFVNSQIGFAKDPAPYPLFIFSALLPWQLFSYALTQSSNSLVACERLITKIYFPRLIVPMAAVISGLTDFAIAFVILVIMLLCFGYTPDARWLLLPPLVFLALMAALAVGIWLSALNVQYRDIRYTIPFLTQIWFWISPVVYPSNEIDPKWEWIFGLNPMAGVIDGFRWALLAGTRELPVTELLISGSATMVLFVGGLFYFRKLEKAFADVL